MNYMFKQIPQTMKTALTPRQKSPKIMTDIGGGCYRGGNSKGLPPLRRTKLSKKAQEMQDEIHNKLYEVIKGWNDWRFQLH